MYLLFFSTYVYNFNRFRQFFFQLSTQTYPPKTSGETPKAGRIAVAALKRWCDATGVVPWHEWWGNNNGKSYKMGL